jgi:hypothetical protein
MALFKLKFTLFVSFCAEKKRNAKFTMISTLSRDQKEICATQRPIANALAPPHSLSREENYSLRDAASA